jgi:ribosomal protein L37AE/L43A
MKNEYNKCPFCDTTTIYRSGGLLFDEYDKIWECPKCGVIFKNIYRLEYHGREVIIPPKEREDEE